MTLIRKPHTRKPRAPTVPIPREMSERISYAQPACARIMPKSAPVRHEGYRRLVAAMPCAWCGIDGMSQAAHADEGKGLQIKSDDRTCYPMCSDGPEYLGCHSRIGASGFLTRDQRRLFEAAEGKATRAAIKARGLWPADLAEWPEGNE